MRIKVIRTGLFYFTWKTEDSAINKRIQLLRSLGVEVKGSYGRGFRDALWELDQQVDALKLQDGESGIIDFNMEALKKGEALLEEFMDKFCPVHR